MSDIRTVFRDIGVIFIAIGCLSVITVLVPVFFQEYGPYTLFNGITTLLITAAVFIALGSTLYYNFRHSDPTNFRSAMVTAALGWLFVSFIGSIPFWLLPYNVQTMQTMDILSSFFESLSGWSGTGLTMVEHEELLPYTLQFWRSFTQWIGGIGVIVLTLSILARPGTGSYVLYRVEGREQRTYPPIVSTIRTMWWIYLLYTIVGVLVLIFIGLIVPDEMTVWQSINHGMVALATGGFSVTDNSMVGFGGLSQLVLVVLMIVGSIAFASHYELLRGRYKKFFRDTQLRAFIVIITAGIFVLAMIIMKDWFSISFVTETLPLAAFQFISALSCTGFQTIFSFGDWSEGAKLFLAFAMIIGGAAGSTAGGIKLFRAILLYKGVGWRINRALSSPRRVFVHKLGEKSLPRDTAVDLINEAAIISFIWIIFLFISVLVLSQMYPDHTLGTIIFEVCSAQGNVGLTTGLTHIGMFDAAKIFLIINMWVGRLEIIPIIVLFRSILGIKRNIV